MPGGTAESREVFWRKVVLRQRASGLPVKRFCQREGLAAATFYLWKRRLAQRESGQQPEVRFASVRVVGQEPGPAVGGVIEIHLAHECCIRLHGPVDAQQLAAVVAVLEASEGRHAC